MQLSQRAASEESVGRVSSLTPFGGLFFKLRAEELFKVVGEQPSVACSAGNRRDGTVDRHRSQRIYLAAVGQKMRLTFAYLDMQM